MTTLKININAGIKVDGGPGVGWLSAAGNPWTVNDAVAVDFVGKGFATPVGWSPSAPPAELIGADENAALRTLTPLAPSLSSLAGGAAVLPALVSPLVLYHNAKPTGIAPSGTITAANPGTVAFGTALPEAYTGVTISLYFPATGTLAAGFYDVDLSSTTAGTLTGTNVATGGAYTGATNEQTCFSFTLPANLMGSAGALELSVLCQHNASANIKTSKLTFGGASIAAPQNNNASNVINLLKRTVFNRGTARQIVGAPLTQYTENGPFTSAGIVANVDTTADVTVTATAQLVTATDVLILGPFTALLRGY